MSNVLRLAGRVIGDEYNRLCNVVRLLPVPLDVYQHDPDASADAVTPLGTSVRNGTPGYSAIAKVIVLPLYPGNAWPASLPAFPPTNWNKYSADWPVWRIELWHEVIHQVSADHFSACDPTEPGRQRSDGTTSSRGHGLGWFRGVSHCAANLGVHPDVLDQLLDT